MEIEFAPTWQWCQVGANWFQALGTYLAVVPSRCQVTWHPPGIGAKLVLSYLAPTWQCQVGVKLADMNDASAELVPVWRRVEGRATGRLPGITAELMPAISAFV